MKSKITLNDVAKVLGISKATVSLAINADPRVAEKTRLKVLKKIEELGYVYNRGAAGLTTGKSNTIGLAVHDLTNPYFAEVCAAIELVITDHNKLSFLCNTNESLQRQATFIDALIEHQSEGLILCPAQGTDYHSLKPIFDRDLPAVLIARDIDNAPIDFVGNDGQLAFETITHHLIKMGHTRIAMIGGGQQTTSARTRRLGFYSAMKSTNIEVDETLVIDCETTPEGGEYGLRAVMQSSPPPTAIVCLADLVALGVLSGLHYMNLQPGKDIAVVSCDDIAEASRGYVQLTTARIKKSEIGRRAASLLLERIESPSLAPRKILLEPELIIRKTCGATGEGK